jgi:photosystem II stability/assembly factor-like uncharacterized protein
MSSNGNNGDVTLLLGTARGAFFFHSSDDRKTWRMTGPHLDGWEVYSLYGCPRTGRILAGTSSWVYGPTIRVSDDEGKTWRQIERGPAYGADRGFKLQRIWQIVHGGPAAAPGTLYAGVEDAGLFVSRDNGDTWSEVDGLTNHPTRKHWFPGGGGLCLHTIVPDPADPKRLTVGISAAGVFRTRDGGTSWDRCNTGLRVVATGEDPAAEVAHCVHKIVPDPRGSGALFMQYHGGVYRSDDGADTWRPIETGLPGNFGFPMAATPDGTLYVVPLEADERRHVFGGRLRVYRSRDGGAQWQPAGDAGLPADPQYVGVLRDAMTADARDPAGVYFGTSMGEVFASRDGGDSWAKLPGTFPRITAVKVMAR